MSEIHYPTAFKSWGDEEQAAIDRVLTSQQFTMGQEVFEFEEEFAKYHGMNHAIMVNSGSSANLVAVAALFHKEENPLQRGDQVIVPAIAWATTYAPLIQYGLQPIIADVDASWNASIVEAPSRPRLIVGCSILGNPAHLAYWQDVAYRVGAYFIEDNCESLGAKGATHLPVKDWNTSSKTWPSFSLCGTFGLLNTFSFFYSHQLSAIEGGMILTNDAELDGLCRLLRNHGNAGWFHPPPQWFDETYNFVLFGYNVRPLELHAAIAREQLKKLEGFRRHRQQNWNNFKTWAQGLPIDFPAENGVVSPFGLQFTVKDMHQRAELATELRHAGIDCRLPTGGSFRLHPYGAAWSSYITPVADHIHRAGMFLGNAPFDISDKILQAVDIMGRVLRGRRDLRG